MQPQYPDKKERKTVEQATLYALGELGPEPFTTIHERRAARLEPIVMIVDDDKLSCTLVSNVIRKDFNWITVQDGEHTFLEYVRNAPDVLILDIGLPDISGHDVLEGIFQIDPEAYVIMFSRYRDEKNVLQAVERGAQGYVGKPFTREKLFQYLSRSPHLAGKKKLATIHPMQQLVGKDSV